MFDHQRTFNIHHHSDGVVFIQPFTCDSRGRRLRLHLGPCRSSRSSRQVSSVMMMTTMLDRFWPERRVDQITWKPLVESRSDRSDKATWLGIFYGIRRASVASEMAAFIDWFHRLVLSLNSHLTLPLFLVRYSLSVYLSVSRSNLPGWLRILRLSLFNFISFCCLWRLMESLRHCNRTSLEWHLLEVIFYRFLSFTQQEKTAEVA